VTGSKIGLVIPATTAGTIKVYVDAIFFGSWPRRAAGLQWPSRAATRVRADRRGHREESRTRHLRALFRRRPWLRAPGEFARFLRSGRGLSGGREIVALRVVL